MKKITSLLCFVALLLYPTVFFGQIALDFDGADDKVDCGNTSAVQITGTNISLEAWIYPTKWQTNVYEGNVICKEDNNSNAGYMLRVGAGGKLNFALGNGTKTWSEITSGALLSLNTWQHIAGTYDGTTMRIYINGQVVDSNKVSISIASANINLLIGAHHTYSRYYQGIIDEIRIWNSCRAELELATNMSKEFCNQNSNLKLYYKFNKGKPGANNSTKKTVNDLSGNNTTGTLNNFALTGSNSNWTNGVSLTRSISYGSLTLTRCDYYYSPSLKFKWQKTGVYNDTISTAMECDSAITVNLKIIKSSSSSMSVHECKSFISPVKKDTFTKSGVYVEHMTNKAGCDSQITIYLTIDQSFDTIYSVVCNSYTSPSGKYMWTTSGIYVDTLINYKNCDSLIQINLTVNHSTYTVINASACLFHIGPGGNNIYRKTGIYKDTFMNYKGCDSIVTTNLKILRNSASIAATACESYLSPSKKYTWTVSGNYKDTIMNKAGCDSTLDIALTVLKPSTKTLVVSSCSYYISPTGKKYTTTGNYTDILRNAAGCDSVIKINLTVTSIDKTVTQSGHTLSANEIGAQYQWLDCKNYATVPSATQRSFTPVTDGSYAVNISKNGCSDTSNCTVVSGVATKQFNHQSQLILSPNPTAGKFNIASALPITNADISVVDVTGRVVYHANVNTFLSIEIELTNGAGIYRIIIAVDNFSWKDNVLIAK